MRARYAYRDKLERIVPHTLFDRLPGSEQSFVRAQAERYGFTHQELKRVCDIAKDLRDWGAGTLDEIWPLQADPARREDKRALLQRLIAHWQKLREEPPLYPAQADMPPRSGPAARPVQVRLGARSGLGIGRCPVASEHTRCCNLTTLDAVQNCGFRCSYCSIHTDATQDAVYFDLGFADKLKQLRLDPNRIYHIGTGQSGDSLLWGNKNGVLDALLEFAWRHPNAIVEFKSKSRNVSHLLDRSLPPNLVCSWSLNTESVIAHEEHGTASLERRLAAARRLADQGVLVGFHLHPMIHYQAWQDQYGDMIRRLCAMFDPREVAMVSMGSLTFTRPVIKRIRRGTDSSRVLRMPMVESRGRYSYPDAVKIEMFRHAHDCLAPWRDAVFMYLCMETPDIWRASLGYDYGDNQTFEAAMQASYLNKIRMRRRTAC